MSKIIFSFVLIVSSVFANELQEKMTSAEIFKDLKISTLDKDIDPLVVKFGEDVLIPGTQFSKNQVIIKRQLLHFVKKPTFVCS